LCREQGTANKERMEEKRDGIYDKRNVGRSRKISNMNW